MLLKVCCQPPLKPTRRRRRGGGIGLFTLPSGCCQQDPALDKSSMVLAFTLLAVSKPTSWRTRYGLASCLMVNTSVNLPQSKDRSGSTRLDCKIAPAYLPCLSII
ncbi:hypothetical protein XENOCAPTIV_002536 [Xenoophorus captivus]|uniref:Uncharacterized protein n=1 Tax=Xenoophorus captivus TaxID=1517983 RepID=A0ABV0QG23_9TELE